MEEKITCVIIDNDPASVNSIAHHIGKIPELQLMHTFTNPFSGLEHLKKERPDVLFLDIDMEGLTGLELLQQLDHPPAVIMCTCFREFGPESFELNAIDYLLKPIPFDRFLKAVRKAEREINGHAAAEPAVADDYIFVRINRTHRKVDLADINYIQACDDVVKLSLDEQQDLVVRETFKSIVSRLPEQRFLRTSRSFLVAIDRIYEIGSDYVLLSIPAGKRITLTLPYRERLMSRIPLRYRNMKET